MTDQKEYLFYKNLVFIWRKKWILLMIPIIISLIVAAFSFFGSREYVGKAVYYTSTLDKKVLTDPDLLKDEYLTGKEKLEIDFGVISSGKVQLKVVGDDQGDVQNKLKSLGTQYFEDLKEYYKKIYTLTEESKNNYEQNLENVEPLFEKGEKALEANEGEESTDEYIELYTSNVTTQELIKEYEDGAYRKEADLAKFVEPKLLSEEITKSDNYLVQNMVVSFALSFFLTLIGLMLWRYIREARRALND